MSLLEISPNNALYYEAMPPKNEKAITFVFFNALTGDTSNWEALIAPTLREAGHGTLTYNMRGQVNSPFSPETILDSNLVVEDALLLLRQVQPQKPILVGLSIGGLFAARAWLQGADAVGLVLINTLRRDSARLRWIGDALVRAAEVGGLELFRDLYLPLLMNEDWLQVQRDNFLEPGKSYRPLKATSGHYKLLAEAGRSADWDLPYEALSLPTLVVTGLQDHVFLESEVVRELAHRLPRAKSVDFPNAGHLIPAEQPHELAETLLTFAREVV